jgi:hypothetical protein
LIFNYLLLDIININLKKMKKIVLAGIFLATLSCSNEAPTSPQTLEYVYNATIMQTCPNGSRTTYSINKTTYDNLEEYLKAQGACQSVFFKDISATSHTGFLAGIGRVSK